MSKLNLQGRKIIIMKEKKTWNDPTHFKRDVEAGEEVFLDYGYDPYNCPQWFSEELIAFKQSMTEEEEKALSPSYASFVVWTNIMIAI